MMRAGDIVRMNASAFRHCVMRWLLAAVFAALVAVAARAAQTSSKAAPAESFDVPIKTSKVVKLHHVDDGIPQDASKLYRNTLTCYYFPGLMVKQEYDQDDIGCKWLAIHRFRGKRPACRMSQDPGEQRIQPSEWNGYYRGVKGSLVFFDAGECQQGYCSFAVYDSITGKKVFEDGEGFNEKGTAEEPIRVFPTKAGVAIRYPRVREAGCDLHLEGKPCWEKVKAKFHLKSDRMPHCDDYDAEIRSHLIENAHTLTPSMISYPVEVTLSAHPVSKTLSGPVRCWPVE